MSLEAALSRRMLAQVRASSSASGDETARAYLQDRTLVYSRVMFWAFVALRALEVTLYWRYPEVAPSNYHAIFVTWLIGLAAMGLPWRGLLVRRRLSRRALAIVELVFTASSGVVFGVTAVLAFDRHESAFTCLIYACFVVFVRALILPSSARWTALVSSLAMVPLAVAACVLAATTHLEIPAVVFVVSAVLFSGFAVVIATVGSRLIYGLRRRVTDNMRLGQYTLERKIGEGGAGSVYRAAHALLRRPTAIKLMHPDRISADALVRFEREVQQMSELTHPNTVAIYDYGHSPDGVFYYVMEHIDGIDLERLVAVHGRQSPTRIADILGQICGALHEAHHRGLVHRDVKPANILLCDRGGVDVAKIVDFGLAREIEHGGTERNAAPAAPTPVVGTPAYVAPETLTAPNAVGPAADVYALGAVGYFLLTGKRVFDGATVQQLCRQHLEETPALPGIDPPLEAVLLACLSKDPGTRPSAERLGATLRGLPRAGWDEQESRTWWRSAREIVPGVASAESATTITVDLVARS